jgi:uncharacterized protein YkwD
MDGYGETGSFAERVFNMNTKLICCACVIVTAWTVQAGDQADVKLSAQEKKLVELTNAERKKKNLEPLRVHALLFQIARAHSQNMAKQGKLEHVLDGKNPLDRLRDAGYKFIAMGENVAKMPARDTVEELMKMWMDSKIHHDNIVNPDVAEIGLGVVADSDGQVYYTQLFGKRR